MGSQLLKYLNISKFSILNGKLKYKMDLITAVRNGNVNLVRRLIPHVNLDVQDRNGFTALMYAVRSNNAEITRLLLVNGANPNIENINGNTAIFLTNNYTICFLLLRYRAEVNIRNRDYDTPLTSGFITYNKVDLLLRYGADPNERNGFGVPILILATQDDNLAVVELLLQAGADPNLEDEDGMTALDYANEENNMTMVNLIVSYGA